LVKNIITGLWFKEMKNVTYRLFKTETKENNDFYMSNYELKMAK